jgi:hypothetical protein
MIKKASTRLSSADIGKAIGRARRTVNAYIDAYIADLRAVNQMVLTSKYFACTALASSRTGLQSDWDMPGR